LADPIDCLTAYDAAGLQSLLERLPHEMAWSVLALDYELGYLFEPKAAPPDWAASPSRPLLRCWRFAECRQLDASAAESWLQARLGDGVAGIGGVHTAVSEENYQAAIARIQHYIAEGDCYQVNYTLPLNFSWYGSPLGLYARLRQQQPVRYGGFVGDATQGIVSLSPELFLERRGERLQTRPMKGTAPRSVAAEVLRTSVKDRAENLMIVDLLRNDLGRVAENGSVSVDGLFAIEEYPTVWQMVSTVSARVGQRSLGKILAALFPCGSITGAPKIRAMQIAAELEAGERGLYTGALGWLAPDGDFRLNVAIRTLELAADGSARMGIGSGIVADSEGAAEWQECLLKAGFLRNCDPGIKLIETLRRENGSYPMWPGHLRRLRRSADWLGFPLDEQRLFNTLGKQPATGIWRVRLTLDKAGNIEVQSFALDATPPTLRQATLSETGIDSRDPLRRHKTTSRRLYDEALRDLPADSPIFDLIFLNERGEVAEGARSTVFVEREGVLLTPPLASGALPGVLRAHLLEEGKAREAVLYPSDLQAGFLLGNAVRGLIPVRLVE
jgi:para-aminobenzoate synthetase / 4-amino-4-deoxychorismate lyase